MLNSLMNKMWKSEIITNIWQSCIIKLFCLKNNIAWTLNFIPVVVLNYKPLVKFFCPIRKGLERWKYGRGRPNDRFWILFRVNFVVRGKVVRGRLSSLVRYIGRRVPFGQSIEMLKGPGIAGPHKDKSGTGHWREYVSRKRDNGLRTVPRPPTPTTKWWNKKNRKGLWT